MKQFKILILCYVIILLLLNAFTIIPKFKIKNMHLDSNSPDTVENILTHPLNDEYEYKQYDVEIGKNGEYILLYSTDQLYCHEYGKRCEHYMQNQTKIKILDEHFNEISSIGGYHVANKLDIVYNNISYAPYSLAQLDNGNIVAFGKAVDLKDEILYPSIFVMNSELEIIDSIFLDLQKYQFENKTSGHVYFEVISSNNSGFTVKYTDLFRGSVVIHFNNELEEEWSIKYDDIISGGVYSGSHLASYTDTLFYSNETYYVIIPEKSTDYKNNYTIYSYDQYGKLKWKQSYDFYISNISVIDDDIIISGRDTTSLFRSKNLLIKEEQKIDTLITAKINPDNGSIEWKRNYYLASPYSNFEIINTIRDDAGYYYPILHRKWFYLSYNMLILKYDKSGKYVSESILKGSYNSYRDLEVMNQTSYKTDIRLINNTIQILTPSISIYREIDLDDISFSDSRSISFNPSFYNTLITMRLFFNRLTTIIIIVVLGYAVVKKIRKNRMLNVYVPDDYTV